MQLVWFRRDLRVRDNPALSAAMEQGPTIAVFLPSPTQWQAHGDAPCKIDFWQRNLVDLAKALKTLNVPLLIKLAPLWSDAPHALLSLCENYGIHHVHINDEYGVNEVARDQAVCTHLAEHGIGLKRHMDQLLFAPGSIATKAKTMPKVFGQFRLQALNRLLGEPPRPRPMPKTQAALPIQSDNLAKQNWAPTDTTLQTLWPAGEDFALERLSEFADDTLFNYHHSRDLPALPGTSALSPYLNAGVISTRQCLYAAMMRNAGQLTDGATGAATWINQLLWREFYQHILIAYPKVSCGKAFKPATEAIAWRTAPDELRAWQQGKTGFLIIDAAMRQLLATGWMHNRLRMICAMFLSKNLLIDWREGERFFMQHLIDGDLAANNGGWQWSASTGTDSVPYFRIFNPQSQAKRFDPHARFIRTWLPELAHLSDKELLNAKGLDPRLKPANYPSPMLDLGFSRTRALAAFATLKERPSPAI